MRCQDVWSLRWVCLPMWDTAPRAPTQPPDSEGQHSSSALLPEIVTGMKFTYDCRHLITVSGDRWERPGGCAWLASLWEWARLGLWGAQGLRQRGRHTPGLPCPCRELCRGFKLIAFSFDRVDLGVTPSPEFKSQVCHLLGTLSRSFRISKPQFAPL